MSLDAILEVVRGVAMADTTSYWLIGALTLAAFLLMRAMLPVKGLAFVFAPVLFWGGLAGLYAGQQLGYVPRVDDLAPMIVASTGGMILALVLMMCFVRLADRATRSRAPGTKATPRIRVHVHFPP